jgi:CHAT domain-containing protein/tetratricopeptide (TPR) repeat protein
MILLHSRSTQSKYRSWTGYCGLVLSVSLLLIQIHASPNSPYADLTRPAQENQQTQQLELGKPIERELAEDQSHSYQMTLAAGQYVKLVVDQRGIDVVVKLFGPNGKQLIKFDIEGRTHGQEIAPLVAEEAGSYRVDAVAKYKNVAAGRYEIQVVELRAATDNDRALQEAYKLNIEGFRLYSTGKDDEALPLFERALEIRERVLGPEHPDIYHALHNVAILYELKGDLAKAESLNQRGLTIREKAVGPEHPDIGNSLNNLAIIYLKKGDYAKAELFYQRSLKIKEKALGPEHRDVSDPLHNLANLYSEKGDFARAEPLYQRALEIREKVLGPEHRDVAQILNRFGVLYDDIGYYAKAELFYQRALKIREKALGAEHIDVSDTLVNLASLYRNRGDYALAEPLYQRALKIRKKVLGPEHRDVASILNNLGFLYAERGDYTKAEPFYQLALKIREKVLGSEELPIAINLADLAGLYEERGDYAKAELFFQRALTIKEKAMGPEHSDVAYPLNKLADFYLNQGDFAKAEPLYRRALTICEKTYGAEHPYVAICLNRLAEFYRRRGDYGKAAPFYQQALAIQERSLRPEDPKISESLNGLAMIYTVKGEIAQAVGFRARANAIDERNLTLNLASGSERQKLLYLSLFSKRTDFTLSLQSQVAPNDPQALDLAFTTLLRRKGRGLDAMTDMIATLRRHASPQDKELFDKFKDARSQLASLKLKEPESGEYDTYRTRVKNLEVEVDGLEAELSSRIFEFHKQAQPVTIAAVQAALPATSALVEFVVFSPRELRTEKKQSPRYLAYLLTPQGQPKWIDLGEAALIDRTVDAWRKALRDPNRTDVKRLARAVDAKVMRPVRSLLREMPGEALRLLIAPDGALNLIPFAALVDERNRYLIERYSISYLTCGRDLLRLQISEPSKAAPPLIVANPDFGRLTSIAKRGGRNSGNSRRRNQSRSQIDRTQIFFQPLPATKDEALAIKALLPNASVLQREAATEAALKQARGPQILHIATHGFFLNYQGSPSAKDDPLQLVSSETTGPAAAQTTAYTLQLEATPALETAQETVKRLWTQGVDAYIIKSSVKGKGTFFRVRVGKFPSLAEANKYGADLQEKKSANDLFVARYEPPQEDLIELSPTIPGALTKLAISTSTTTPPADSQSVTEPPSGLRLSKFVAQVKDPLLRSGLALAGANHGKNGDDDGVLTALEAAYLELSGTKLVVLSACDTGVGEVKNGEGVQGLRRALVLAGSESQVISLWPVSDEATKDLMIPYYKALQQGEGRGDGLRQVQLHMLRGRKDRRHPFFWAAFIQSGEWANLDGQR